MYSIIYFEVVDKDIKVKIGSTKGDVLYYNTPIHKIEEQEFTFHTSGRSLVEVLKEMQDVLGQSLKVYYLPSGVETIDSVIQNMVRDVNGSKKTISPQELKDKILVRKAYARYYYEMFRDRQTVSIDNIKDANTKIFAKDAKILAELLSYYFIKRLVHVFIMCTIYESIVGDISSSPSIVVSGSSSTYDYSNDIARLNEEKKELELKMANSANDSERLKILSENLEIQSNELNAKNYEIEALNQKVNNYKELLLSSHDLLFKIGELPNF